MRPVGLFFSFVGVLVEADDLLAAAQKRALLHFDDEVSPVRELNRQALREMLKDVEGEVLVNSVMFYSVGCPVCTRYAPVYKTLASAHGCGEQREDGPSTVHFSAFECTTSATRKRECIRLGIDRFPTLRFFWRPSTVAAAGRGGRKENTQQRLMTLTSLPLTPEEFRGHLEMIGVTEEVADCRSGASEGRAGNADGEEENSTAAGEQYLMMRWPRDSYNATPDKFLHDALRGLIDLLANVGLMSDERADGDVLEPLIKKTLSFVDAAKKFLPGENIRKALADFSSDVAALEGTKEEVQKSYDRLVEKLELGGLRRGNSSSADMTCTTSSCRVWLLLHILALGSDEHQTATDVSEAEQQAQLEQTMNAVRDFLAITLACEECRVHFLNSFDACAFNRCEWMTGNFRDGVGVEDPGMALVLWTWRLHNAVNVRTAVDSTLLVAAAEPSLEDSASNLLLPKSYFGEDVRFPPASVCTACRRGVPHFLVDQSLIDAAERQEGGGALTVADYEVYDRIDDFDLPATFEFLHQLYWDPRWSRRPGVELTWASQHFRVTQLSS